MNNTNIQQYIGFIQNVCAKYECADAANPLIDGLHAFCEAAFQHPTFDDPVQHKAYWKNVFFRLKTIRNVLEDIENKLWKDIHDKCPVWISFQRSEKRDKSGYVLKGAASTKLPIEFTFTMPYPDNYNILVTGKVGKQRVETVIPETELASTEWQFDGTSLKEDWFYVNISAYDTILHAILSVTGTKAPTDGVV